MMMMVEKDFCSKKSPKKKNLLGWSWSERVVPVLFGEIIEAKAKKVS